MELTEPTETETKTGRTYAEYPGSAHLNFDPLKDLNLPANYEEVRLRYERLRPDQAMETLN